MPFNTVSSVSIGSGGAELSSTVSLRQEGSIYGSVVASHILLSRRDAGPKLMAADV